MMTLDASVLIAHLAPADPHHELATGCLHRAAGEVLLIHSINLAEVLVGGARAGRGQEMLEDILAIGVQVAPRRDDEPLRLADLRATSSRLKLRDCCALDTALATGSTLATVDLALAEEGRRRHLVVAPRPGAGPGTWGRGEAPDA